MKNREIWPLASHRWAGWVWETTGLSSMLYIRQSADQFRAIYSTLRSSIKKSWKISSTRNQLDYLETLESWPIFLKIFRDDAASSATVSIHSVTLPKSTPAQKAANQLSILTEDPLLSTRASSSCLPICNRRLIPQAIPQSSKFYERASPIIKISKSLSKSCK